MYRRNAIINEKQASHRNIYPLSTLYPPFVWLGVKTCGGARRATLASGRRVAGGGFSSPGRGALLAAPPIVSWGGGIPGLRAWERAESDTSRSGAQSACAGGVYGGCAACRGCPARGMGLHLGNSKKYCVTCHSPSTLHLPSIYFS